MITKEELGELLKANKELYMLDERIGEVLGADTTKILEIVGCFSDIFMDICEIPPEDVYMDDEDNYQGFSRDHWHLKLFEFYDEKLSLEDMIDEMVMYGLREQ